MERIAKWCFATNNVTDFYNKKDMNICFIVSRDDDKHIGYKIDEFGSFLSKQQMQQSEWQYIFELTHEEKQKLISFGHNQNIINFKGSPTYFEPYWTIFYSPSNSKRTLALRYSFELYAKEKTEEYISSTGLSFVINSQIKATKKLEHDMFSNDLTTKQFFEFIQYIEDEEKLFNMLIKYQPKTLCIKINEDDNLNESLKMLKDHQVLKLYIQNIPALFFRRNQNISTENNVFEVKNPYTNELGIHII